MNKERSEVIDQIAEDLFNDKIELQEFVKNSLEQAERMQELEEEYKVRRVEYLEEHIDRLEQQNQRYKQALEQVWEMTKESIMDGRIYIVIDKALKGESE